MGALVRPVLGLTRSGIRRINVLRGFVFHGKGLDFLWAFKGSYNHVSNLSKDLLWEVLTSMWTFVFNSSYHGGIATKT